MALYEEAAQSMAPYEAIFTDIGRIEGLKNRLRTGANLRRIREASPVRGGYGYGRALGQKYAAERGALASASSAEAAAEAGREIQKLEGRRAKARSMLEFDRMIQQARLQQQANYARGLGLQMRLGASQFTTGAQRYEDEGGTGWYADAGRYLGRAGF